MKTKYKWFEGSAQMLFIRLFMRKRSWIRKNSIKYPEIGDNLTPFLHELVDNKFLFNGLFGTRSIAAISLHYIS